MKKMIKINSDSKKDKNKNDNNKTIIFLYFSV